MQSSDTCSIMNSIIYVLHCHLPAQLHFMRRNSKSCGHAPSHKAMDMSYWNPHMPWWTPWAPSMPYYPTGPPMPYWSSWTPPIHCCSPWPPPCHGESGTYGGDIQPEKKKRRPKTNKNDKKSDDKTLQEREDEAKKVLMTLRVSYDALDMATALAMHVQKHYTSEQRLALRVAIAAKMIPAKTEEAKALQFASFVKEMDRSMPCVDDPTKTELRAIFLKAAYTRKEPKKHAAKHLQELE